MTEEERDRLRTIQERNFNKKTVKERQKSAVETAINDPSSIKVIMDLEFDDKMDDRGIRSICSQLNFSYGANLQAVHPVHLILSGMSAANRVAQHFNSKVDGFSNWKVTCYESSYWESLKEQRDKLIYLTADAGDDEILADLENGKYYIIGALVDHNHHKNLTLQKAIDQNIPRRKLPIPSELIGPSRKVLAVNHVMLILLYYLESKDWNLACQKAIPPRKIQQVKEQS